MKNKIVWIDNLKGLAIIAVVIGHMASPLSGFIYAWHIPLFFFVSGLLLKSEASLKQSTKKDFFRLIIPFIVFSLIGLFFEYLKHRLFPGFLFINGKLNFRQEIIGIFWWMDFSHLHHYGFVLWFLPALFWSKVVYRILLKVIRNKYLISLVSLLILLFASNRSWLLPFGIDKAFLGLFWLSLGWLLAGRYKVFCLAALFLLPIPQTDIALKVISGYGVIYSLLVINTLVGFIRYLPEKLKIFQQFGKESMLIFVIHPYINNLSYFLTVYLLGLIWVYEVMLSVIILVGILSLKYYAKTTKYAGIINWF